MDDHLTIVVLANKRLGPLVRLLTSLREADYAQDSGITLHIRLEANQPSELVDFVVDYHWPHGEKVVHSRIVQGGLIAAVVEGWFPSNDHEFGLILEDDIEVSPLYYLWVKAALRWYRESGSPERVVGVSLYTPRTTETGTLCPPLDRACRRFDPQDLIARLTSRPNTPFLQQLPCSWGAVYFPTAWRAFARYMQFRVNGAEHDTASLLIPGSRTTGWKQSWKKYFVEYQYINGYFLLYPNFPDQASLSTNHLEEGEHITRNSTSTTHINEDFTVPLLRNRTVLEAITSLPGPNAPASQRKPFVCSGLKDGDPSALYGGWCEGGVLDLNRLPALDLFATPYDSTFDANDSDARSRRAWMPAGEDIVLDSAQASGAATSPAAMLQSDAAPCVKGSPFCRARMLIQEDGNVVVNIADFGSVHGGNLWASKSGSKRLVGKSMALHLESNGNLALVKLTAKRRKALWVSGYRDEGPGAGFYAHVSPAGLLGVYRGSHPCERCDRMAQFPCNHFAIGFCTLENGTSVEGRIESATWPVWRKGNAKPVQQREGYDMCPPWRRRVPRNHEGEYCEVYHTPVADFFRGGPEAGFTVMISYHGRSNAIFTAIQHYAGMRRTDKIVVVWRDATRFPPQDMKIGSVLVHFLVGTQPYQSSCRPMSEAPGTAAEVVALASGFIRPPSMLIRTRAVLAVDDDVLIHEEDCTTLFEAWQRYGDRALPGLFPAVVTGDEVVRPPTQESGYNALLSSAMILPIELIRAFKCGGGAPAHFIIDQFEGAEDIALNLLARRSGLVPLYVRPAHEVVKLKRRKIGGGASGGGDGGGGGGGDDMLLLPNKRALGRDHAPAGGLRQLLEIFEMELRDLSAESRMATRERRATTVLSSGAVHVHGMSDVAAPGVGHFHGPDDLPLLQFRLL